MRKKFFSARVALPTEACDLRKVQFETDGLLECVPHLHLPVFPSNMPMFYQLPVDLVDIEAVPMPGCLTASRYAEEPRLLSELTSFIEHPFQNPRIGAGEVGKRSLRISKKSEHEKIQVTADQQDGDIAENEAAFRELLDELFPDAIPRLERLYQRKRVEKGHIQEVFMLQGVRVVLNHTSARVLTFSLKFSLSSIFAKDIVAGALEQLRRADVIKYCVHLAHYSFKQDRESLYKRGKDWSLSSCGGYADDFDPLPRPDCVLGKYGRIFPTFHLTEDAMDFDSGVRLDIVHREGGSFMELHSFEGREKIEKAAEIFAKSIPGFNPNLEWWDGAPEDRWLE